MTAKEYLKQARHLEAEINYLMDKIEYWRSLAERVSGNTLKPNYNATRPTEASFVQTLTKIEDMERQADEKLRELMALKAEIESRIDTLINKDEQLVLHYRYINNCSWEEISRKLYVSVRSVFRIHGSALENFSVPE